MGTGFGRPSRLLAFLRSAIATQPDFKLILPDATRSAPTSVNVGL